MGDFWPWEVKSGSKGSVGWSSFSSGPKAEAVCRRCVTGFVRGMAARRTLYVTLLPDSLSPG